MEYIEETSFVSLALNILDRCSQIEAGLDLISCRLNEWFGLENLMITGLNPEFLSSELSYQWKDAAGAEERPGMVHCSEKVFEQLNQDTQEKAMQPVKEVLAVLPLFKENNKENNTEKTGIAVLMNDNSQYSGTIFFMGVDEEILNREEDRKLFREIGIIIQNRINRNRHD